MMGGGRMGKNSYNSRTSSSTSMFNGDVGVFECWCHGFCVVRKANTVNNAGRLFYACPLPKDDGENCQFFIWVDEAEELGYFKNNGAGHGRNARLMEKPKDSDREVVWRARMMDKVDCVGSELRLIKILIGEICLIELFKVLLYCAKSV